MRPGDVHDQCVLQVELISRELALVQLSRPAARNALSSALRREIVTAFADLEVAGVRVVILTGAGTAFCAGLDLNELINNTAILSSPTAENPAAAVDDFSGVVIAAVNGPAITGGLELMLACDIVIASDQAVFADTHAAMGILPGWGLSQRLARLIGRQRAKWVSLTGRHISAREALELGICSTVVPHAELMSAAYACAAQVLRAPPGVDRAYKALVDDGLELSLEDGLALETRISASYNRSVSTQDVTARRWKPSLKDEASASSITD